MSRIHDALKRAEQERATSTGTHSEPTLDQQESPRDNMPSLQPTLQSVGNHGHARHERGHEL
jgi:hypothetical protein